MKNTMKILSLAVLIVVSLGIILYPLIANFLSEKNRSLIETQYIEAVEQMDTAALDNARAVAVAYNETLLSVPDKPYTKDALIKASESYDTLLNVRGDGIMGYVEIPAISVNLPIYHGTEESTLDRGVGHLLGSSLPVGGLGTHCVLTGHSGLAGQKMFSDLNLLKEGDIFLLRILGQTLAYKVCEINTVLPEDTSKLTVEAGCDLCTLVTCTPYGVNSHRLLIRGERTEYEEAISVVEDAEFTPVEESTWGSEYRHGLAYGGLTIAGIGTGFGCYKAIRRARKLKYRPRLLRQERKRGKHEAH